MLVNAPKCVYTIVLLAGFSLSACGCRYFAGLEDYEKHIDEEQQALDIFDERNKLLGDPLQMPRQTMGRLNVPLPALKPFFLRPPKPIKIAPLDQPSQAGDFTVSQGFHGEKDEDVVLYYYPGPPGYGILFTDASAQTGAGGIPAEQFRTRVRAGLANFMAKHYQLPDASKWITEDDVTKTIPYQERNSRGQTVEVKFETQSFKDMPPHYFELYFVKEGTLQGAVIYELPADQAEDGKIKKELDYSRKTLGLGSEADAKLRDYNKYKPKRRTAGK